MLRSTVRCLAAAAFVIALPSALSAQKAKITVSGVFRDIGAAPAPTPNFTLSFTVDRSPLVCGGATGAFLACYPSMPQYTNGPLDVTLSQGGNATLLFRQAVSGGGFAIFQSDVSLNALSFLIGSAELFTGGMGTPTLLDGVYAIAPNPVCTDPRLGCTYNSYAAQSFGSGDVINNPFNDPITLQSYDPIESGTITIEALVVAPEPGSAALILTGLIGFGCAARSRSRGSNSRGKD
jgi:hypothetical protein